MILVILAVAGLGFGVYEFLHNAAFKKDVSNALTDVQSEYAAVRTKVVSGVAVVDADLKGLGTKISTLFSKL